MTGIKFVLYLIKNVVDAILRTFTDCNMDIDDWEDEEFEDDEEDEEVIQ